MHPLTDAFIKGRTKFKKETRKYFGPKGNTACHLGAIIWGVYGVKAQHEPFDAVLDLKRDFPEIHDHLRPVPCDHVGENSGWEQGGHITSILIHLNDEHDGRSGWTDKKVAEWLDSVLK